MSKSSVYNSIVLMVICLGVFVHEIVVGANDLVVWIILLAALVLIISNLFFEAYTKELFRIQYIMTLEAIMKVIDVIAYIQGYQVYVANSQADLEQVYRLRYEVYLEKGYITPNDEEMFRDKYDSYSKNVVVKKRGNGIVGALRLAFDNPEVGMPVSNYFNVIDNKAKVEFGRWVVSHKYRSSHTEKSIVTILIGLHSYSILLRKRIAVGVMFSSLKLRSYIKATFDLDFESAQLGDLTDYNRSQRKEIEDYFKKDIIEVSYISINIKYIISFFYDKLREVIHKKQKWISSQYSVFLSSQSI